MNIFGQAVIRGKKWDFSGLPRLFSMDYEAHRALLGEREFLLIEPNESVKPLQMQKLSDLAEEKTGLPVVFYIPGAQAVQRERLVQRNIAWFCRDELFSIPFLGVAARPDVRTADVRTRLTPRSLHILTHLIDGRWENLSTTEIAEKLGVRVSSVVNNFREIEAVFPGSIGRIGRKRYLRFPEELTREEMLDRLIERGETPVRRVRYLRDVDPRLREQTIRSGMSVLADETDIADDPFPTCAAEKSSYERYLTHAVETSADDEPELRLEEWLFSPHNDEGKLNQVALHLSLATGNREKQDERVAQALDVLRRRMRDRDARN